MRAPVFATPLVWQIYLLIFICGLLAARWPLPASLCAAFLLFFSRRLWTIPRIAFSLLLFLGAGLCCFNQLNEAENLIHNPPEWIKQKNIVISGQIHSVTPLSGERLKILLANVRPEDKNLPPLPGYCAWTWENPQQWPLPGQKVSIQRQLRPARGNANEKNDSYLTSLLAQNCLWRIWSKGENGNPRISGEGTWLARERQKIEKNFLKLLMPEDNAPFPQSRAILFSLLFGSRYYLNQSTVDNFSKATIAHSLALSGQHLGVAGIFSLIIVWLTSRIWPSLFLTFPKRALTLVIALPFAACYLWLGNAPASLIRAAAMLAVATIWLVRGSAFHPLDLLAAALALILAIRPMAIFETGLQMSAICVAIIILTWPVIARIGPNGHSRRKKLLRWLGQLLAVSFVIQLALLPYSLALFHQAGVFFPINLIWLPMLGFIVLPCAFFGLILSLFPFCAAIAQWFIIAAEMPVRLILNFLQFLDTHDLLSESAFLHPLWTTMIGFALLVYSAALSFGNQSNQRQNHAIRICVGIALILLAAAPAMRLYHQYAYPLQITALDVGQGQSIIVSIRGSQIVIDGGGSHSVRYDPGKYVVLPQLSANRNPHVSAVINSHPDLDHVGGLFHILQRKVADTLFHNGRNASETLNNRWQQAQNACKSAALKAGDIIQIGHPAEETYLEVLHPPASQEGNSEKWNGNGASLVLRLVKHGTGIALFTGDCTKEALKELCDKNTNLRAKIIIAPHHGSDKNFLAQLYEAAKPELVIASCGYWNQYQYPGKELRKFLALQDIKMLNTGANGRITIDIGKNNALEWQCIYK